MNANVKTFDPARLRQFTGTETYYKHGLTRMKYTDGVAYVAESAGAYWLLDEIGLAQRVLKVQAETFQVWKLSVSGNVGTLTCDDGNSNIVHRKSIPYTDFPAAEIKLYHTDGVLLLPSEY